VVVIFYVQLLVTLKRSIFWKVTRLMSTAMAVLITRGILSSSSDSSGHVGKMRQEHRLTLAKIQQKYHPKFHPRFHPHSPSMPWASQV